MWARDNATLTQQENRAKDVIAGTKTARTPRFVKTAGAARSLDHKALARARRLAGLRDMSPTSPSRSCRRPRSSPAPRPVARGAVLQDEQTDLAARPMFHRTPDAIEAHLTASIVFTALAVARETQHRSGLAIRNLVRQLRPLRSATIAINGATQTFPPAIPAKQQALPDAIPRGNVTH